MYIWGQTLSTLCDSSREERAPWASHTQARDHALYNSPQQLYAVLSGRPGPPLICTVVKVFILVSALVSHICKGRIMPRSIRRHGQGV